MARKRKRLKVTAISDTHTQHDYLDLPGGDILVHTGDISYFGQPQEVYPFIDWMSKQDYTHKIFIAGNHDLGFEDIGMGKPCDENGNFTFRGYSLKKGLEREYSEYADKKGVTYLEQGSITVEGYKIYGSPWTPAFCQWAFNYVHDGEKPARGFEALRYVPEDENAPTAKEIWADIPEDTDILLTHGPALGILDRNRHNYSDNRCGCKALLERIKEVRPMYHIFGHIHEQHGRAERHGVKFINAASCTIQYTPTNKPISFYLKRRDEDE